MSRFRFRDEESSTGSTVAKVLLGAIAGFAVGMYVAQRAGGLEGLTSRIRRVRRNGADATPAGLSPDSYDEIADDADDAAEEGMYASAIDDEDFNGMDDSPDFEGAPLLEERVLEAFNNDPILAERAIDIGAVGMGVIELAGWVDSEDEAEHAMTVARGIVGVTTVVNRLMVDDEEQQIGENARRFAEGDPALSSARWEGQQVGTGKRRQGTSEEADRHADPKPALEERWLSEREAVRNAAEDVDEIAAERRSRSRSRAKPRQDEAEPTA